MGDNHKAGKIGHTRPQNGHPTIGLLIANVTQPWERRQWLGVVDAAQDRDVNLLCFAGEALRNPNDFNAQRNVLYDLVDEARIDGLVLWLGGFSQFVDQEEIEGFCRRYDLPAVGVEGVVEGIPSVLMDDYQAMREAIRHLIKVHGYQRIAFIAGAGPLGHHPGVEERYRAYVDMLAEYGLPSDPSWTITGSKELDDWLSGGQIPDVEAVVGHADGHALAALQRLQSLGARVPGDVAVVGFNDNAEAAVVTPPLTTVRPPFYEMGRQAMEMVLAMIAGEEVPEQVVLPSKLIVRESCGCLSQAVVQAAVEPAKASREKFEAALTTQQEEIVAGMMQAVEELGRSLDSAWAGQLLNGFAAELAGESAGAFLAALDKVLRQVSAHGDVSVLHGVLSALRRYTLPYLDDGALSLAEDLWQQARVMIGETAERAQAYKALQAEQQAQMLQEIGESLITTFDVGELTDVLAEELPGLGMPSAYLSLYEDPEAPAEWSRLILAYGENGRIGLGSEGCRFPSPQLVPEGMWPQGRRYSYIVESLYFREHQLGVVLFEVGPREGMVYEALRGQLSSALQGAMLFRQAKGHALQLQTAAEVSRAASGILDPDELIHQVVDLARERFDLYYVGLFLVDDSGRWAVLRSGTGEAGQKMVEQGHKLEVGGESMIGWCVAHRQARIALDVTSASSVEPDEEAVRFENPLLPETRSELALPLISRGEVLGALTVQSTEEAAFSDEDINVLQAMTDQLANAIANARLFEQAQQALAEVEDAQRRYLHQAWEDYAATPEALQGYVVSQDEERPVADAWLSGMTAAVQGGETVVEQDGEEGATLAFPIALHGEVIGAIGLSREGAKQWSTGEIAAAEAVVEQVALALENQRLFEEAQRATFLTGERVKDLDCLNDIGRQMEGRPPVPEFLQWMTQRVPEVMRHAEVCVAAVEYEGQVYGVAEALELPHQIAQGLRVRRETVGRITVAYKQAREFLNEESALLGDVARRVSGYIENQRLLQETQARAEELAVLNEMSRALTALRDMQSVVESIYHYTSRLMDTTNFYVALYHAEQDEVSFVLNAEGEHVRQGSRRRAGQGMTEYIIRSREPLLIKEDIPAWQEKSGVEAIGKESLSWLGVPMLVGDQVLGVIAVQSYTTPRLYNEHDRDLLIAVASQAAIAIQNARLFEQTQARAERERLVRTIADRVRRGADTEAIMRTALQELSQLLGTDRLIVRLGTQAQLCPESLDPSVELGTDAAAG